MRRLDLLQKIDPHRIPVPLPRQQHLDEIRDDAQLHQLARIVLRQRRHRLVRSPVAFATRNKVARPHPLRHRAIRKRIQPPPHVSAVVAILQPPRQNLIQRRS